MKLKTSIYLFSKKTFTRTNLMQNKEILRSFNDNEVALNWSLAKLFVNAKNKVSVNNLEASKDNSDSEVPTTKTLKEIGLVKFINYQRKIGKLLSQQPEIYVQTGKVNGKDIRVISSEKDVSANYSSLFEAKTDSNSEYSLDILVMTKGELNVKPFLLSNPEGKIVITNSKNVNYIKELISKI